MAAKKVPYGLGGETPKTPLRWLYLPFMLLLGLGSMVLATQLYLRHNGPEHIMVFAPTRSGKGVGLILPTLLAWEGSSIVLDIKGENWALTAGWRKSQEQLVLRFDPSDPSGASARFNPLEEIRLATLLAIPNVQNMAAMLVDPTGKGLPVNSISLRNLARLALFGVIW